MKQVRTVLLTLGGIFLAALLIAALAPRATRAVAAALVQVTNTTSSPVPVLDVASKQPFISSCESIFAGLNFNGCSIAVPLGKTLVIQTVSAHASLDPGVRVTDLEVITRNGGASNSIWMNLSFGGNFGPGNGDQLQQSQQVVAYADPGTDVTFVANNTANTTINQLKCTIYGYLVNTP